MRLQAPGHRLRCCLVRLPHCAVEESGRVAVADERRVATSTLSRTFRATTVAYVVAARSSSASPQHAHLRRTPRKLLNTHTDWNRCNGTCTRPIVSCLSFSFPIRCEDGVSDISLPQKPPTLGRCRCGRPLAVSRPSGTRAFFLRDS
jgi:hypothetical protein